MNWVKHEIRTANILSTIWKSASHDEKNNPDFIFLLIQLSWCNTVNGKYSKSTIEWHNKAIAKYFNYNYVSKNHIVKCIIKHWPTIIEDHAKNILENVYGITHYYRAYRTIAKQYIKRNIKNISRIFFLVSRKTKNPSEKIKKIMKIADNLPLLKTPRNSKSSILNALTPALACLDPNYRFPIMNQKTDKLLHIINKINNIEGAVELSKLIKQNKRIRNSFELDVYSQNEKLPKIQHKKVPIKKMKTRFIGFKSEENSIRNLKRRSIVVRKLHNKLIAKFKEILKWCTPLQEADFDILIPNYKRDRILLIEVKSSSVGSGGRLQIRQAIGQLFDYRHQCFPYIRNKVDLAILLPSKPMDDILLLLKSIRIHVLWFKNNKLCGTIKFW